MGDRPQGAISMPTQAMSLDQLQAHQAAIMAQNGSGGDRPQVGHNNLGATVLGNPPPIGAPMQGAYGSGAQMYTGYCAFSGCYSQNPATIQGQKFAQYMNDATINPFSGRLEQSTSFTATASYLHYWTPEWRSAFFGSYGEMSYSSGARLAQGAAFALANPTGNSFGVNAVGVLEGKGAGMVVVGAHHDTAPEAPGAYDDGGGVGVVIEVARAPATGDYEAWRP